MSVNINNTPSQTGVRHPNMKDEHGEYVLPLAELQRQLAVAKAKTDRTADEDLDLSVLETALANRAKA